MPADPYSPPRAAIEADPAIQPIDHLKQRRSGPFFFGGSYLLGSWIAAGLAVYGFGFVEPMWGRGGSFQVLVMAGTVTSLLATIGFALSAATTGRFSGPAKASTLGLIAATVTPATFYLHSELVGSPASFITALLLTAGIGALAPLASRRVVV